MLLSCCNACFSFSECPLSCPIGYSPNSECTSCVITHICLTKSPCENGATCQIKNGNNTNYTCLCVGGYSGDTCEGICILNL